jgi:hypothetical protein
MDTNHAHIFVGQTTAGFLPAYSRSLSGTKVLPLASKRAKRGACASPPSANKFRSPCPLWVQRQLIIFLSSLAPLCLPLRDNSSLRIQLEEMRRIQQNHLARDTRALLRSERKYEKSTMNSDFATDDDRGIGISYPGGGSITSHADYKPSI